MTMANRPNPHMTRFLVHIWQKKSALMFEPMVGRAPMARLSDRQDQGSVV